VGRDSSSHTQHWQCQPATRLWCSVRGEVGRARSKNNHLAKSQRSVLLAAFFVQIFLDHNSTTPVLDEVVECMAACYRGKYANPASQHAQGRSARRMVEDARDAIATALGARTDGPARDRLVFTSGGTEANNLALLGMAADSRGRLLVSSIEHPSVMGPGGVLAKRGWQVDLLSVNRDGVMDVQAFEGVLQSQFADGPDTAGEKSPCVTAVMLGNNETGVLQPLAELSRIVAGYGIPLHTDAVQVVGKLPVDFQQLGASTLAFSAHKFHGPQGIGGLLIRGDAPIAPLLYGGFQQGGLRPGTEPVALVVGMQKALEIWQRDYADRISRMTALRDRFEAGLRLRIPSVVVNGADAPRLPHTSNVAFVGFDRRALAMALDLEGVACSTGSACASGSSEPSPVLIAMGLAKEVVAGSLRFSLGATTTEAEIDEAVERTVRVVTRMRGQEMSNCQLQSANLEPEL
jgi:cysteine desulfurase